MSESPIGAIETEIALLMRRAETTRRATPRAGGHRALDRAAYVILRRLDEAGPLNVGALASALGLDGSTVTRQVTAMERAGLVARRPDPRDGRGTLIEPTRAGLALMGRVRTARQDLYRSVLSDWPASDRQALAKLLHRLNESLDAHIRGQRPQ